MSDNPERVSITTPSPYAQNLLKFKELFPGVVSDGVVDLDRLLELLDLPNSAKSEGKERFGLSWAGKSASIKALQQPSFASLKPEIEKSVNWNEAKNVFIEGDNLEVLKILQKSHNDKIKMIYIDPPYNTENDFVYNDDFSDSIKRYLQVTGQADEEGNRLVANSETQGRKHSNWLSMMYPRLVLARNLLTDDGVIFISIDDNEYHNLKSILDEIFSESNYIGTFIWRKKFSLSFTAKDVISIHEYVIAYRRNSLARDEKGDAINSNLRDPWWDKRETVTVNPVFKSQNAVSVKIVRAGARINTSENFMIEKGVIEISRAQSVEYLDDAIFENGLLVKDVSIKASFAIGQKTLDEKSTSILFSKGGAAYVDSDGTEEKSISPLSILFDYTSANKDELWDAYEFRKSVSTRTGTEELNALGLRGVFDNPKPTGLMNALASYVCKPGDTILDFFGGSGSTAHAIYNRNDEFNTDLHYILVQLDEDVAINSIASEKGFQKVSDITLERLKEAMKKSSNGIKDGLRVFKLATNPFVIPEEITSKSGDLLFPTTIKDGASKVDLVSEMFLKCGVQVNSPWENIKVETSEFYFSDGVLACVSEQIAADIVDHIKSIPNVKSTIFLEDSFAGLDAIKANTFFALKTMNLPMKTI